MPTSAVAPTPKPEAPAEKAKEERSSAECPEGNVVDFPNADFEAAVRKKLEKPEGDITQADLKKLRSLNVSQIRTAALDVCVFPHMTGLKELFLGPGKYTDLSPIAGATQLESLRASQNKVSDLSPLAKMTKLDRLDLGQTEVSDLTALAGLVNLTELMLDGTQVSDLAPLAKMTKLERVGLANTKVKDISPLGAAKKLKFVYVAGTPAAEDMNFSAVTKNGTKVTTE
jgi:internalin A